MRTHRTSPIRVATAIALAAAVAASRLYAQSPATSAPAFDAASIRQNTSGDPASGTHNAPGGRIMITNQPLVSVIRSAYGANDLEIVGAPDWALADRWDIRAVGPPGTEEALWQPMLKTLLEDRCKFRAHIEQRERPIFNIVLARRDSRLGPDLHPATCDAGDNCGSTNTTSNGIKSGTITATGRTIAQFGATLSRYAERRVFDQTGLDGTYDFHLQWSEDVSIFTALQEQLGLKLEPATGPIDVLVIDHVERPTPD
jgi:uncharacterized protein (TIGR03435 family)